tara:strand:+ start:3094 stop:3972 length:879 start_codon:yes stop_codon:yes gene_type:complete
MTNIPVFLASDDAYAPYVASTIASVCNNTKSFINFYILDGGITKENKDRICKLKEKFDNFSLEFININIEEEFKNFDVTMYFSLSMYSRFLIPQLKPEISKAIYLDVDISVLGDIKDLYDMDLNGHLLGAVKDEGNDLFLENVKNILSLDKNSTYFNSGVLLMDLEKWRQNNIISDLLKIEREYRGKLQCVDQDILNKCFENNYLILDKKFNVQYDNDEVIIRHFVNYSKPWRTNFYMCDNKVTPLSYFDEFWSYVKMTDFYQEVYEYYDKSVNSNMLNKRMSMIVEKMRKG